MRISSAARTTAAGNTTVTIRPVERYSSCLCQRRSVRSDLLRLDILRLCDAKEGCTFSFSFSPWWVLLFTRDGNNANVVMNVKH